MSASRARRAKGIHRRRGGFTLVELLIVMVLLSVVGLALTTQMLRQGRFYRGVSEVLDTRNQMRSAVDILTSELRAVSASGGDIYAGAMGPTSVEFRSNFGSTIACALPALNQIRIPPNSELAAGNRLTFLGNRPLVGHGVFVLDEGATDALSDDSWQLRNITAVADFANPCNGTAYTGVGDAGKSGLLITLDANLPPTVAQGALVRFVKRVRYGLYAEADGKWYLGYCESNSLAASCNALQPVSGPYRPEDLNAASGQSGLNFYYYDEDGNATADRLSVARIDLAVRGMSGNWVSRGGEAARGYFADTSRVIIGVRNRR